MLAPTFLNSAEPIDEVPATMQAPSVSVVVDPSGAWRVHVAHASAIF